MAKKKYKPSTANYEAKKYQIFGSREMWLSEQKEKNRKHQQNKKKTGRIDKNIEICHLCKGEIGRVCQFYKGHFYCEGCRPAMLKQKNPQKSVMEFTSSQKNVNDFL